MRASEAEVDGSAKALLAPSSAPSSIRKARGQSLTLATESLAVSLSSGFSPDVCSALETGELTDKGNVFIVADPRKAPGRLKRLVDCLAPLRSSPLADPAHSVAAAGIGAREQRMVGQANGLTINTALRNAMRYGLDNTSLLLNQELSS